MGELVDATAAGHVGGLSHDVILDSVQLGWLLAEVRGRNRADGPRQPGDGIDWAGHALPLGPERTAPEQEILAEFVLGALAQRLDVDRAPPAGRNVPEGSFADKVRSCSIRLAQSKGSGDEAQLQIRWDDLTELMYRWDAHIQDSLSAASDLCSCAYQLGRGLSETYWALSPGTDEGPTSWGFLLGSSRCVILSRFLGRLGAHFDAQTAPAIAGSLEVWKAVVKDPAWRGQPDAVDRLREQTRRWYELLVLKQDPRTLVGPYALLKNYRVTLKAAAAFWPQLALGVAATAALVTAAVLIAKSSGSAVGATILAVLGVLGITSAGLQAKLKSTSQALLVRIRADIYTDLVAEEITSVPTMPARGTPTIARRKRKRETHDAIQRRGITAPLND